MPQSPKRKLSEAIDLNDDGKEMEKGSKKQPDRPRLVSLPTLRLAKDEHDPETSSHNCPLCLKLLYKPIRTSCSHTFCQACLSRYFATMFTPRTQQDGTVHKPCPMCRQLLSKSVTEDIDQSMEFFLQKRYGDEYAEREDDVAQEEMERLQKQAVYKKFYVGNTHRLVTEDQSSNYHNWGFFLRMDTRQEESLYIDNVVVHLHRTFHPSTITLCDPPFEIARRGWGTFNVHARVHLRPPYVLGPSSRCFAPSRGDGTFLDFVWMLDFEDEGSLAEIEVELVLDWDQQVARSNGSPRRTEAESAEDIYEDDNLRRLMVIPIDFAHEDDDDDDEEEYIPGDEEDFEEEYDEDYNSDDEENAPWVNLELGSEIDEE
ncbi:hypothetical protein SpCBS45565_g01906 [Spizellomyces sp. 'palustris']|nr:hypothetical protein SpCBS45565_g01906 [Spizellomyces sp. 'palustris']